MSVILKACFLQVTVRKKSCPVGLESVSGQLECSFVEKRTLRGAVGKVVDVSQGRVGSVFASFSIDKSHRRLCEILYQFNFQPV
jgi:hypothetical protein